MSNIPDELLTVPALYRRGEASLATRIAELQAKQATPAQQALLAYLRQQQERRAAK